MFERPDFPITLLPVGQWSTQTTTTRYTLDETLIKQLLIWVQEWAELPIHNESTWVQQEVGVPTLIARFDLHPEGKVIELEIRPQGVGTTKQINSRFVDLLAGVQASWPNFSSVQTERHAKHGCDDHLWLQRHTLGQEPAEGLVLVRNMTGETAANHLASRAVAPVANEGDKSYGEAMGWWQKSYDPQNLPWNEAFVIKPLAGAKSHSVGIWVPSTSKSRPRGAYTKGKIETLMRDNGPMWLQPFHQPPVVETEQGTRFLMLRPYFGYDITTGTWHYLGGEYVLGDTLRIHGGPATIFGPLV